MTAQLYQTFTGFDQKFDAVVIGSGIGGLSVAAALSKAGKKVLVLERHHKIGGFTHTFQRKGYEWDVGLHYVGQVQMRGSFFEKIFRYISDGNLHWAALDDAYDRAVFGDKQYDFVSGRANFKAKLKDYFPQPEDQRAIDEYFVLLDEVENLGDGYYIEKALPPFLAKIFGPWLRKKVFKYSDPTTLEVLQKLTSNERLIGVLTAQYGDYGLMPSQSSFYMHAVLANHYMEGAGYPIGGARNIANTIMLVIEAAGGALVFKAEVKKIIVKNNRAVGVEMADGREIRTKLIISDAGVMNTFGKLLPEDVQKRHHLKEKLQNLEPSAAHMGLYIGIQDTPENLQLPKCNYWIFPDEYSHEKGRGRYKSLEDEIPVAYVSFPSAKDPQWSERKPGKSTVECIILVPYEWFSKWESGLWKQRGEEYEKFKNSIAEQLFEKIYRVVPQIKGKIDHFEISSPVSTKHFTNWQHGEIYGVAHTPKRFRQDFLKPYTPVKNLFLTGQDAMIASIAGGMMGGILCASAILKRDVVKHIMRTLK